MKPNDMDHAVRILRGIAYAPHGGKAAQWAQAQLQEIQRKVTEVQNTSETKQ